MKKKIKDIILPVLLIGGGLSSLTACNNTTTNEAEDIVSNMTLREKIGQKMVMSFRYWCESDVQCTDGLTQFNGSIGNVIAQDKIGGVILFANNQTNIPQTAELIWDMQDAVADNDPLGLFIAVDQEGGNVVRLPRDQATNFSGNMALGAAYLATNDANLAYQEGKVLGAEIASVGFNVNFAPVVDVQSNSLNPVINVRSYGEDPSMVGLLGGQVALGMSSQNVISTFKHYPGHGDTATDSHFGLPRVDKSKEEALASDLLPYIEAINNNLAPDMVMTAHIQYPSLDDSMISTSKTDEEMLVPATLSRKIQYDLLRQQLGYQGVTITDALDMKGISSFFDEGDAVIKVFQAGVDIALMPTQFRMASDAYKVKDIIDQVVDAVHSGELSEKELNSSVSRIISAKLGRGILNNNGKTTLASIQENAAKVIGNSQHKRVETEIVDHSITLIKNQTALSDAPVLPMSVADLGKVHIITPWAEQAEAMLSHLSDIGVKGATGIKISTTNWETEKEKIDVADTLIVGSLTAKPVPVVKFGSINDFLKIGAMRGLFPESRLTALGADSGSLVFNENDNEKIVNFPLARSIENTISDDQFARLALEYAESLGKTTIMISLRSPSDIVNYDDVADVVIAAYNYYGYDNGVVKSDTPRAIIDVISGKIKPTGKLPVNVYTLQEDGTIGELKYLLGYGQSY